MRSYSQRPTSQPPTLVVESARRLDEIARSLRRATRASRVTIRIRGGGEYGVVAESCAVGVDSVAGTEVTPAHAEVLDMLRNNRVVVQSDVSRGDVKVAPELSVRYGVVAQLVAPVLVGDELIAIVSVHDTSRPRDWEESEQEALADAVARVAAVLAV